jgi:protein-tyrosine phosphatase
MADHGDGNDISQYHVMVVCLGNICRSPMAAAVLRDKVQEAGLADKVQVSSAGTAGWHTGDPADHRARATLRRNGYDDAHRAQRFSHTHAQLADLVLAMDTSNHADLESLVSGSNAELRMFREFDEDLAHLAGFGPDDQLDVPDPYYGPDSGFDAVLAMIESAADGLIAHLQTRLANS